MNIAICDDEKVYRDEIELKGNHVVTIAPKKQFASFVGEDYGN